MFFGFREREQILSVFETITGLRMNHAYIRPGGLAADLPDEAIPQIRDLLELMPKRLTGPGEPAQRELHLEGPHAGHRLPGSDRAAWRWASPGPCLRSTGLPHDLRKAQPYCGYENYEFDVITDDAL